MNAQHIQTSSAADTKAPAFHSLLAIGAMLATLLVIAYAGWQADDGATRAQIILQGLVLVLINLGAGLVSAFVYQMLSSSRTQDGPRLARAGA